MSIAVVLAGIQSLAKLVLQVLSWVMPVVSNFLSRIVFPDRSIRKKVQIQIAREPVTTSHFRVETINDVSRIVMIFDVERAAPYGDVQVEEIVFTTDERIAEFAYPAWTQPKATRHMADVAITTEQRKRLALNDTVVVHGTARLRFFSRTIVKEFDMPVRVTRAT